MQQITRIKCCVMIIVPSMQLWFGSRGARGAATGATAVPRGEGRGEVGVGCGLQRGGSVAGGRVEGAHDQIANERENVE